MQIRRANLSFCKEQNFHKTWGRRWKELFQNLQVQFLFCGTWHLESMRFVATSQLLLQLDVLHSRWNIFQFLILREKFKHLLSKGRRSDNLHECKSTWWKLSYRIQFWYIQVHGNFCNRQLKIDTQNTKINALHVHYVFLKKLQDCEMHFDLQIWQDFMLHQYDAMLFLETKEALRQRFPYFRINRSMDFPTQIILFFFIQCFSTL